MAKSDLLKEAIADAKAVKETALANAKIALQEAFAPRLERMLATKLTNEIEGEDEEAMNDLEAGAADVAVGADELEAGVEDAGDGMDVGDLSIDVDNDGEFDEFDIMSRDEMPVDANVGGEEELPAVNPEDEYNEGYEHDVDDLDLESIIRELEGDLDAEATIGSEDENEDEDLYAEGYDEEDDMNIDEIIESILREEDLDIEDEVGVKSKDEAGDVDAMKEALHVKDDELQEAYKTVRQLKSIINEVNLLNAKLLYTNKLFRNFELNESQKMKVIENFDRAGNTREVKLVFSTLAESFARPTKKRVVKESYASKAVATTKPTTPIISEGFDQAERWKKLAGLL
jgi:hypothetical protein